MCFIVCIQLDKKKSGSYMYVYLLSAFLSPSPSVNNLEKEAFENIVGLGENAGNQHFILFPQSFLSFPKQISHFSCHIYFVFCKCFKLYSLKICSLVVTYYTSRLGSERSVDFIMNMIYNLT